MWHGPRTLTKVRQVCIPIELLRALNVEEGGELLFSLNDDRTEIRVKPTGRSRSTMSRGGA